MLAEIQRRRSLKRSSSLKVEMNHLGKFDVLPSRLNGTPLSTDARLERFDIRAGIFDVSAPMIGASVANADARLPNPGILAQKFDTSALKSDVKATRLNIKTLIFNDPQGQVISGREKK